MALSLPKPKTTFLTSKPSPLTTFVLVLILCILSFYALNPPSQNAPPPPPPPPSHFRKAFLSYASNSTVASYLRRLTLHPHLTGTKLSSQTTNLLLHHFRSLSLQTHTTSFNSLLSFPLHSSLSLHFPNGSHTHIPLREIPQNDDDVVLPYHAYSPSASAFAKAVFVNFGREMDYRVILNMGVSVEGCVVIARKGGGLSRGAVVEKAEEYGAVAVLIYSGGADVEGDVEGYFGKGVERGHVMRGGIGDPLSPGWGGVDGGERLGLEDSEVVKRFPKIPSLPLAAESGEAILWSLGGVEVPLEWKASLGNLRVTHVGPGPTVLNFTYEGEKKVGTVENVFAVIKGSEEPDRFVLLGNHRDAWTYGAVDPGSGTAALLDIARRFSLLLHDGWTPRRTIILCSWDAEEFGMIGSTEWVEQNIVNLGSKAVAYLNVDCAVQGSGLFASSTPQLDELILEVTKEVKDPDAEGATLYENLAAVDGNSNILRLSGLDSDFAPFVQHAGVPSTDLYYGRDFPVYHTAFDSYNWMTRYGDPLFQRHVAVAGVWGLLALHLADDPILPFNYHSYVDQLQVYRDRLVKLLDQSISLEPLTTSIQDFASAVREFDHELNALRLQEGADRLVHSKTRALNDRLMLAEKGFLDSEGLRERSWFKHLVFGPPSDHESKMDFFPGVADSIAWSARGGEKEGQAAIQHEIWKVARAIKRAASALRGELM